MSAPVVDLSSITGVADIVLEGEPLWVCPGVTPAGRFWALSTPAGVRAGLVAEHDGVFEAVGCGCSPCATATDAARLIVASLRGAL